MTQPYPKLPELRPQDIKRFWSKVDKTPGQGPTGKCWRWVAGCGEGGYGAFWLKFRNFPANRIAYFLQHGEDPGERLACHRCDWPPCCRGSHLFAGTYGDNQRDCAAKLRHPHGDNHYLRKDPSRAFHALTPEQAVQAVHLYLDGYSTVTISTLLPISPGSLIGLLHGRSYQYISEVRMLTPVRMRNSHGQVRPDDS